MQGSGFGFESREVHSWGVAQLAVRRFLGPMALGSNPSTPICRPGAIRCDKRCAFNARLGVIALPVGSIPTRPVFGPEAKTWLSGGPLIHDLV